MGQDKGASMALTLRMKAAVGIGAALVIAAMVCAVDWKLTGNVDSALGEILEEHRLQLSACDAIDADVLKLEPFFHGGNAAARSEEARGIGTRIDHDVAALFDREKSGPAAAQVERLRTSWSTFRAAWDTYARTPGEEERGRLYREKLAPTISQVAASLNRLRNDATANVVRTAEHSRRVVYRTQQLLVALLVGASVLAALVLLGIGHWIITPLRQMRESVDQIERGEMQGLNLPKTGDEIGLLGAALERMAAALHAYRQSDEARLERTRQTTQLAIESLTSAVAIVSPEGRVEIANETARRLFHIEPGMALAQLEDTRLAEMLKSVLTTAQRVEPKGFESAVQMFDASGERFFLPHMLPIIDKSAAMVGVTLVLSDVTGLRRIDEAKSGLISTVSHELKTPLTSIQMCIHLLLDHADALAPNQRELLETARQDSDRLGQIIEGFLDIGRLQAGRAQLQLEAVRVADLIEDAISPLHGALAGGTLKLDQRLPATLPLVLADRPRIRHALENLLSNAAKYTPEGGTVTIDADADETMVHIRVADTGIGIPEAYLPTIFEKFVRTPMGAARNAEGAGLGLAIAREVVEAHGGSIQVVSTEGKGSTFTMSLRRAAPGDQP